MMINKHFKPNNKLQKNKVFLVGGAVRDILLGIKPKDYDYLVLDYSEKDLLDLGFEKSGNDFSVFRDSETHEEYALPRHTNIKPSVDKYQLLKNDLYHRDLTINAMAMDMNGKIIDPFGGKEDINNKLIRHVSKSFKDDPIRVLRIARFASRYKNLGFKVSNNTLKFMETMVNNGDLDNLISDRIWTEIVKTSQTEKPSCFLKILHNCGALKAVFPEIDALYGVPQVSTWHPEIDTGIHTEMVCDQVSRLHRNDPAILFAAMTHDLGKALTPKELLPKHHNHEKNGLLPLNNLIKRLNPPKEAEMLAKKVCELHLKSHRIFESRPGTILKLLEALDAFRHPQRFENFLIACEADKKGRLGLENDSYNQANFLRNVFKDCKKVSGKQFIDKGITGKRVGDAIRVKRLEQIKIFKNEWESKMLKQGKVFKF